MCLCNNLLRDGYFLYPVSDIQTLPCHLPFLSVLSPPLYHFCLAVFFPSFSHRLFHDTDDRLPVLSGILIFSFQTATLLSPSCLTQVFSGSCFCSFLFSFLKGCKQPRFSQGTVTYTELQQSSRVRMLNCELLRTRTILMFLRYIEITLPPT